ncbi:response regulator [Corynebacterium sp. p3-SID1194]|uniref:response regulator n=1 Tax=Corynebacterium sp. p3-SID1194 TaxID=2916105 RepID=UPI0021A45269|nr:response regulator transcription factor [Corynebacterium sp. p3-SID1194]MCT1449351.1 response regulator transcription factor [Corynebacterium sp. p3-SID1194]
MTKILVVDDDATLLRTLRINLRARGYESVCVSCGADALDEMSADPAQLVILDLGLPDIDGTEVLRRVRETSAVPIIVLSARDQAEDIVEALDDGANDFVTKPFGVEELMARVRASLRNSGVVSSVVPSFVADDLVLDFAESRATKGGGELHFTPTEWRMLSTLAKADGALVRHDELLGAIWGPGYGRELNYLRVYAHQIRRKIESDPTRPHHLLTEPGVGYRLVRGR